jgi:regulatory protein
LNRYDASTAKLARWMRTWIKRRAELSDEAMHELIGGVLERLREARVVDDTRYAGAVALGMRERGGSAAKIRSKLKLHGVDSSTLETAIAQTEKTDQDAAQVYARKRRLVQRYDLKDPLERRKALGALARQGFSFDVAQRALAALEESGEF